MLKTLKWHPAFSMCVPAGSGKIIFSCRVSPSILQPLSSVGCFLCVCFQKQLFFQTCGLTSYVNYLSEQRLYLKDDCFWLLSLCGNSERWVPFTSWKVSISCRWNEAESISIPNINPPVLCVVDEHVSWRWARVSQSYFWSCQCSWGAAGLLNGKMIFVNVCTDAFCCMCFCRV